MSVAASRWVQQYLQSVPAPRKGGPSPAVRAVLLVLGADASYPAHIADTPAATVAAIVGYSERHVLRLFDAIRDLSVIPCTKRPGRAARWHFLIPPMSTTPDRHVRGEMSTTPDIRAPDPGHPDVRRRETGSRVTSTDAVPRGVPAVAE